MPVTPALLPAALLALVPAAAIAQEATKAAATGPTDTTPDVAWPLPI